MTAKKKAAKKKRRVRRTQDEAWRNKPRKKRTGEEMERLIRIVQERRKNGDNWHAAVRGTGVGASIVSKWVANPPQKLLQYRREQKKSGATPTHRKTPAPLSKTTPLKVLTSNLKWSTKVPDDIMYDFEDPSEAGTGRSYWVDVPGFTMMILRLMQREENGVIEYRLLDDNWKSPLPSWSTLPYFPNIRFAGPIPEPTK